MRALQGLNPEQKKAVEIVNRHLLVVAGAGSGKTRVLTHKIAHLVEDHQIGPNQILAMTFSNRAANEMVQRVQILLPSFERPRWMGTFHSICLRILKEFAQEAGLPTHFTIYDESDQLTAMRRAMQDLNLDPKHFPPSAILHHIDRAKNETFDAMKYLENLTHLTEGGLKSARRYHQILIENHALDFGDLLARTVKLLKEQPSVKERLQKRFLRILIDEYQDTNRIQKELVKELSGGTAVVCAVGDEDQSIYGWRGARVENILEFEEDFPGAELVKLEQNYRSTKRILTVANFVIAKNAGRREKKLWTENDEGPMVDFMLAEDDYGEASFVVGKIDDAIRSGQYKTGEITIFYRTHVQSRVLEEEFRRRNINYRIFGGVRFYDRAEVKNVLALLRLALNPADNISFLRVVNVPAKGIGDKTLERLAAISQERNIPMLDAIAFMDGTTKAERGLHEFHTWFTAFAFDAAKSKPAKAAETVLIQSGYQQSLEKEDSIESESRLENIGELLRSMEEFQEEGDSTLADYIDRISLVADMDTYDQKAPSVAMMTVHNSKGLEFDLVFVVGLEEGIFPHQRSIDQGSPDEVEEERRLCYVAFTRARKKLVLSAAGRRRVYQSTQYNPVSRFIGEIPSSHLHSFHEDRPDRTLGMTISSHSSWGKEAMQRPRRPVFDEYKQESYEDESARPVRNVWAKAALQSQINTGYPPGTRVSHPEFGRGTVKKCEGSKDHLKLTVQFERYGLKKLSLQHCTLDRIDG